MSKLDFVTKPKKIFFFYLSNKRTIMIETQILHLKRLGYEVTFCSIDVPGELHSYLKECGVNSFSLKPLPNNGIRRYFLGALQLSKLIRGKSFKLVISHLQQANMISSLAFKIFNLEPNLITFRHHYKPLNINSYIGDFVVNLLSPLQVVPALSIRNRMIKYERLKKRSVSLLRYSYDFKKYPNISQERVNSIREKYKGPLLTIISRLVPEKRHLLVIEALSKLKEKGLDFNCLIPDTGPEENSLRKEIIEKKLGEQVHFLGFRKDIMELLEASDILLHPSIAEASCSVIKEAGLVRCPVIACSGVGDFDEYLQDSVNSLVLSQEDDSEVWSKAIASLINDPSRRKRLGTNLHKSILDRFSDNEESRRDLSKLISLD